MGWFSGKKESRENGGEKPSHMSRRNFLKLGGTAAAGAMLLPDVLTSVAADNQAAAAYAHHLKSFVEFGEDANIIAERFAIPKLSGQIGSLASEDAVAAQLAKHVGEFESYTQASVKALSELHGHTKGLTIAQQQKLLHSPEVRSMLHRHIEQQMPKGLLSSPKLIERQVDNTIRHYGTLLERGALVQPEVIEMQKERAVDNFKSVLESETRAVADVAKTERQRKADKKAAEKLMQDFSDTIRTVRQRQDGQFSMQLYPLRAQMHELDATAEKRYGLMKQLRAQFGDAITLEQTQSAPEFVRVACSKGSPAERFFTEFAALKTPSNRLGA